MNNSIVYIMDKRMCEIVAEVIALLYLVLFDYIILRKYKKYLLSTQCNTKIKLNIFLFTYFYMKYYYYMKQRLFRNSCIFKTKSSTEIKKSAS